MNSPPPKDPREAYASGGGAAVEDAINGAQSWVPPAPESPEQAASKDQRSLSEFEVDHQRTLDFDFDQIEQLRQPYVIDQFVRRGQVLLLGAESKSRKSWLAQDAGIAVASGLPWLAEEGGENGFATAKARVHVLDLELDKSEIQYRFAKARRNRFPDDPDARQRMTTDFHSYCFEGKLKDEILCRLGEFRCIVRSGDLVVVDCFYRLVPDGNEPDEVAEALEALKRFAQVTECAVILVDHFRKAGDNTARNRFSGSFIKQASPATLVAVEVRKDETLVMHIDARTFHGLKTAQIRFSEETYTFGQVPKTESAASATDSRRREMERWIVQAWKDHAPANTVKLSEAADRWGLTSPQGAGGRFSKLEEAKLVQLASKPNQKPKSYALTEAGRKALSFDAGFDLP